MKFIKVLRNNKGQGMVEYIIIVALISLSAIAAVSYFGDSIQASMAKIGSTLMGDTGGAGTAERAGNKASKNALKEAKTKEGMNDFEE